MTLRHRFLAISVLHRLNSQPGGILPVPAASLHSPDTWNRSLLTHWPTAKCKLFRCKPLATSQRSAESKEQKETLSPGWPYVVHHLQQALAEGAPADARGTLGVWEGDLPDAGHHPILLHHGIGNLGHLLQVILCSWAGKTHTLLASSQLRAGRAHPAQTHVLPVERAEDPVQPMGENTQPTEGPSCRSQE